MFGVFVLLKFFYMSLPWRSGISQPLAAYTQSHGEEMAQIQIESDGVEMK